MFTEEYIEQVKKEAWAYSRIHEELKKVLLDEEDRWKDVFAEDLENFIKRKKVKKKSNWS